MTPPTEHPLPPLHVWGRRLWRLLAITVLLLVMLRIGWGMLWKHRLHAAEARMRAAGTWVDGPRAITTQNADEHWSLLLHAAKLASTRPDCPAASDYLEPDYMTQSQWLEAHHKIEASDAAVLSLARRARVVWEQSQRERGTNTLAALSAARLDHWALCAALAEGVIYRQSRGDDAEAIRRLRDLLHMSTALYDCGGRDDVTVASQFDRGATASVHYSVAGLAAAPDPEVRRELQSLLADLRNETSFQRAVDAVPCWRQPVFESTDSTAARFGFGWILAPLADRTKSRWATYVVRLSEAARAESLQDARRAIPRSTWEFPFEIWLYRLERFPKMPHDWAVPPPWLRLDWGQDSNAPEDLSKAIAALFESRMARRSAATAIAVHLFRVDTGRWPANLQELVPVYLPSVPIDICAGGSATVQYLMLQDWRFPDGQRPVLYFADHSPIQMGPDGLPVDIHHKLLPSRPDWPIYSQSESRRQYRDLARLSSPQSVNNNPNKPNAAGKDSK